MIRGASSVLPTMPPAGTIEESVFAIGPPASELVAVLARPADTTKTKAVGVVIVVGGPQTRVGSHRQFVIMARVLAAAGHACLRFDYTGMGDSPGPKPDFEKAGPDICRACDALLVEVPACQRIVLWGLCDGATAAILHAHKDPRIAAVVAANPWVRSEFTRARVILSEHYGWRIRSPEFWKKLASGKVDIVATCREAIGHLLKARVARNSMDPGKAESLPVRLASALSAQQNRVHLQLSGRDLTSAEFAIAMAAAGIGRVCDDAALRLGQADHTFSDPEAWGEVVLHTLRTVSSLERAPDTGDSS